MKKEKISKRLSKGLCVATVSTLLLAANAFANDSRDQGLNQSMHSQTTTMAANTDSCEPGWDGQAVTMAANTDSCEPGWE